jgi:hypothetical protein
MGTILNVLASFKDFRYGVAYASGIKGVAYNVTVFELLP